MSLGPSGGSRALWKGGMDLILSRASQSGKTGCHHTLVPATPGHWLSAVTDPTYSPYGTQRSSPTTPTVHTVHSSRYPQSLTVHTVFIDGRLRLETGRETSSRSCRVTRLAAGLLFLSTASISRTAQMLQLPDFPHTDILETSCPGCLVKGTLFTLLSREGINKHIWCSLRPTG